MKNWYSLEVGKGSGIFEVTDKIQDAFFWEGVTVESAAFFTYDVEMNLETIYFTPAAHSIARSFRAVPCERPSGEDIGFVAGDWRCWQTIFQKECSDDQDLAPTG